MTARLPTVSSSASAPIRRRQHERVAESAERVKRAAMVLIAEKGFERTTASEIGESAGYSRAMVRMRYGSKEELLDTLVSEWQTQLLPDARECEDGLERLLLPLNHILDVLATDPLLFRAFVTVSFETPNHLPNLKPRYVEWWRRYEQHVSESICAGQKSGSIRPEIDPSEEAEHFITYATGLCYRWSMDWDGYDIVAALTKWRDSLRHRLAPATRKPARRRS